jgi:hypothetical protein
MHRKPLDDTAEGQDGMGGQGDGGVTLSSAAAPEGEVAEGQAGLGGSTSPIAPLALDTLTPG